MKKEDKGGLGVGEVGTKRTRKKWPDVPGGEDWRILSHPYQLQYYSPSGSSNLQISCTFKNQVNY